MEVTWERREGNGFPGGRGHESRSREHPRTISEVGSDDKNNEDLDDFGEGGSTGVDKMSTIPEDKSLRGIKRKLGEAEKKARCPALTQAATLGNSKLMVKEREDLVLCIEGCHSADVAHALPSNHARPSMGFRCVPRKPLQRELLCEVGEDKKREGGKNEESNPPFNNEANYERYRKRGHALQDHRDPLSDCRFNTSRTRGQMSSYKAEIVLLLVEPAHFIP